MCLIWGFVLAHCPSSITADSRGRTVVYRDAPGHTVAPELHREYTVENRSITGTYRDQFMINLCPKPGLVRSTAGNI